MCVMSKYPNNPATRTHCTKLKINKVLRIVHYQMNGYHQRILSTNVIRISGYESVSLVN